MRPARKKRPNIYLEPTGPPKNLAEFYGRAIKTKVFPNEDKATPGELTFEDGTRLEFLKSNDYYPTTISGADSFALKLMNDMISFGFEIGNTNEVGFEFHLKDNSVLRRVPLGKYIPIEQTAEEIAQELQNEDPVEFDKKIRSMSPLLADLLNAKTINKRKRSEK